MLDAALRLLLRALLSLRYRIDVVGLDRLAAKDARGMLFLPNHPALIDPLILLCVLTAKFPVRALANQNQVNRPGIRWLAARVRVRVIADPEAAPQTVRQRTAALLREIARALRQGEALVLYPAGRIYRTGEESIGQNGAAAFLARTCPDTRIVLVRTTGLWGSAFGRARDSSPTIGRSLRRGLLGLLKSGVFFAPKRHVCIEFSECPDFPRTASREIVNRFLEAHYNATPEQVVAVPYSIWERPEDAFRVLKT
ncbi:MAG: lysophospholipid acyltransferase family protein [Polyangiaceae bacterium]